MRVHARRSAIRSAIPAALLLLTACASTAQPTSGRGPAATPAPTTPAAASPPTPAPTPRVSPTATPGVPASLRGRDVETIPTAEKVVALTFDAGGDAAGVASILSTLSSRHVPATFFLTGAWAARYPDQVRRITAAGYRIGNHTATHPHLTALTDTAVIAELGRGRDQILAAGGTEPMPLFRFPYGDRTAHTISVVNNAGYLPVRWTVDTLGWKGTSGGASLTGVIDRTLAAARPGEIVLMHLGANPDDRTALDAAALPTVITRLTALGYRFVTLDALLAPGGTIPAGCDTLAWRSAPLSRSRAVSVPPVPVVTGIRPGSHPECRYDRIVFDLSGAVPGYDVRYITRVTADPSDRPVTVPGGGTRYLLVVLRPAQAHRDSGASTLAVTAAALGYPMLRGYAVTGDFEGHVGVVLGLAHDALVRVGELDGRLYVDVAY